jgi:hypothetical protein
MTNDLYKMLRPERAVSIQKKLAFLPTLVFFGAKTEGEARLAGEARPTP